MNPPLSRLDVYFLLSHVRTSIPNKWVQRFHQALNMEVELRAEPTTGLRAGSIYLETESIARVALESGSLPQARVIVPLYTREFLFEPPPECVSYFNGRPDGSWHPFIHPVLWDANPGGRRVPGLSQARSLGAGVSDYEECGLLAMCRLNAYARSYKEIVGRLADRIVAAAQFPERTPPWITGDAGPAPDLAAEARFVISLISPQGRSWRAFGAGTPGPIAEQTAAVARRRMLLPEIVDYGPGAAGEVGRSPGVLLVDPWALESDRLRPVLEQVLRHPPPWVTVVLVGDRQAGEREARRLTLIAAANALASQRVTLIDNRADFEHVIDDVVERTRRSFLRQQPVNPPHDN